MESDAVADAYAGESRQSSPSTSSDDDAVNTSTARVYFGPVQSAEKKRAAASIAGQATPVRRSTRRSMPAALQAGDNGRLSITTEGIELVSEGEKSEQSSGRETPVSGEDMLDEPPSALATKVLRAWDNPSPPPSPPSNAAFLAAEDDLQDLELAAADVQSADEVFDQILTDPLSPNMQLTPPADNVAQEQAQASHDEVEEDLIMFDSFNSPTSGPRMRVLLATPPNPSLRTVDDLLALSPIPPLPSSLSDEGLSHAVHATPIIQQDGPREATPSACDEDEVLLTLSRAPSPPSILPTNETPLLVEPQPVVILTSTPEPAPQTPVRRSTRPRRSVSPYIYPLTVSPSKAATPAPSVPQPPSSAATKRRKSRAKELLATDAAQEQSDTESEEFAIAKNSTEVIPRSQSLLEELAAELAHEAAAEPMPRGERCRSVSDKVPPDTDADARAIPATPDTKPRVYRLGSLSPTSTNVLMQLLPSSSETAVAQELHSTPAGDGSSPGTLPSSLSMSLVESVRSIDDVKTASIVPSTPLRPSAASRSTDITRTPARRVLITEAVAQGSLSPEKARSLFVSGPDSALNNARFAPRTPGEPPRSPAKRVLVSQAPHALQSPQKGKTPIRTASSARNVPARSQSMELTQPLPAPKFQRSASVEPLARPRIPLLKGSKDGLFRRPTSAESALKPPEASGSGSGSNTLPFSISSFTTTRLPEVIPEADETPQESTVPLSAPAPPATSQKPHSILRQQTVKAESKIPRPGSKPYARPAPAGPNANSSRIPASGPAKKANTKPSTAGPAPVAPRPMRMVRKVSVKPVTVESSSDTDSVQPVPGPGPNTLAHRAATFPPSAEHPTIGTLKRKREVAESKVSPSGALPVRLIRKVVSAPTATNVSTRTRTSPSPVKKASPSKAKGVAPGASQARMKMRKVVDARKPKAPMPESSTAIEGQESQASLKADPPPPPIESRREPSTIVEIMSSPVTGNTGASSSLSDAEALPAPSAESITDDVVLQSNGQSASESDPNVESTSLRRTTRSRKSAQSDSDVFGPVAPAAPRTGQQRRKIILPPDNSAFSGMSALALKSLTATNTQRNQKQFCEMQTEVIMKDGKRPESPTTKVRNVLEKQREERNQQRQERAARRARKSAEIAGEQAGDVSVVTVEEDAGDSPARHQRGPGEEEDYETPERAERPLKRGRFEEEVTSDDEARRQKRVKWNRGLHTTVFLTNSPPNPKRPPREAPTKKGCLTVSAKTLRLDTMGNVLNADAPVPDIAPESIVVQKFVYADEGEVQPEPSSPAKSTRSKSKKVKS